MKKWILALIVVSSTTPCWSQSSPSIRSGRPGEAIDTHVVGQGTFQLESGIEQDFNRQANKDRASKFINELRWGVSEVFELSTVLEWTHMAPEVGEDFSGLSDWQLGFRVNLIDQEQGWTPSTAIQTRFKSPNVNEAFASKYLAPTITLSINHALTEDWSWGNNLSVEYDGDTPSPTFGVVTNWGYSINDQWSTFFEIYGEGQDGESELYVDTGGAYLASDNLQYDLSIGSGHNDGLTESFISIGLAWRSPAMN